MESANSTEQQLGQLMEEKQEAGVAQAIVTYEAVERAYFQAVAATPPDVIATSYATTTNPR